MAGKLNPSKDTLSASVSGVTSGTGSAAGSVGRSPGSKNGPELTSNNNVSQKIAAEVEAMKVLVIFNDYYNRYPCFRTAVNNIFDKHHQDDGAGKKIISGIDAVVKGAFGPNTDPRLKANYVFVQYWQEAANAYINCANQRETVKKQGGTSTSITKAPNLGEDVKFSRPFDERLGRILMYETNKNQNKTTDDLQFTGTTIMPYDTRFMDAATFGYIISPEGHENFLKNTEAQELSASHKKDVLDLYLKKKETLKKDKFYRGVPSLINTYSLTRLYGSEGGVYLIDQKGQRKWYEIDGNQKNPIGYSKVPTTTSLINWGEGDPYGRTPYHFTDFVFCKYWGVIPNNRLITLRRYPAPIVDNLNFPTMDGTKNKGTDNKNAAGTSGNVITNESPGTSDNITKNDSQNTESGSNKKVFFPPMATALTYFGEETGNTLSNILKFTTGMAWEELEAGVWDVTRTQNPNQAAGAGGLSSGLITVAKTLNLLNGDYNQGALLNKEDLPPDPYSDGPYENRVIGPVNAITKVYKRARGIEYTNSIPLVFEYTARPIGGINSKAVLLDILSNFLVIGSVSAMFWGGQHRFAAQPQGYPFIGGEKGMAAWYRGEPIQWAKETINTFSEQAVSGAGLLGDFFNAILGLFQGGDTLVKSANQIFTGGPTGKGSPVLNVIKGITAERSAGQIPYLQGHKALLTGEPVGEWHVTIGNPMNPIALIGNLICKNIEVEFGDELGPDDFPLSLKITVNLEHGMARDRDAIQSMFNRGMGRIYSLPDNFTGSADYETKVDKFTGDRTTTGRVKTRYGYTTAGINYKGVVTEPSNKSNPTVWSRLPFISYSEDQIQNFVGDMYARSEFRSVSWISEKSMK